MRYEHERMDNALMDEMEELWKEHWEEVANFQDKIQLSVDREAYCGMQDNGLYQTIIARDDSGKLIGYVGFIISTHPHYKNNIFANMDNVFLHKDHRKGLAGYRLFKEAENLLKELGVDMIMMRSKVKNDLSPIFRKMGYDPVETVYAKFVGDNHGN